MEAARACAAEEDTAADDVDARPRGRAAAGAAALLLLASVFASDGAQVDAPSVSSSSTAITCCPRSPFAMRSSMS